MKNSRAPLDVTIALLALFFGFALVWAAENNSLDLMIGGFLLISMLFLFYLAQRMPKPDTER